MDKLKIRTMKRLIIIFLVISSLQLYANQEKQFSPSFCEILGILDEYISRFDYSNGNLRDSLVERFYPHETKIAKHFTELIETYEKEINQDFKIKKVIGNQGHIFFYSESLSNLINSSYILDTSNLASLDKETILSQGVENKIAYLKGIYLRFGSGDEISIANGFNKIKTIIAVIQSLEIEGLKLYKSKDSVPTDYILTFPDSKYLKEGKGDSKLDMKIYEEIEIKTSP
jgi:hypothetical protein